MIREIEDVLWDELKMLQPIIDKFDDYSFRIKNWFITIFTAVAGYSFVQYELKTVFINFFVIIIFYSYEVCYRAAHADFLKRAKEIQEWLRNENLPDKYDSPYLDKYLRTPDKDSFKDKDLTKTKLYNRNLSRYGDVSRALKNTITTYNILREFCLMWDQLRVSLIYWLAAIGNLGLLIWFFISEYLSPTACTKLGIF